jgi:hypothetical protein
MEPVTEETREAWVREPDDRVTAAHFWKTVGIPQTLATVRSLAALEAPATSAIVIPNASETISSNKSCFTTSVPGQGCWAYHSSQVGT